MKEKKISLTVPMVVSIISFIAGCISYFFIDNPVPIHWNVNWEVDQTAPKEVVFLLSAAPMLLYVLLGTRNNSYTTRKGNRILVIACVYVLIAAQWLSIASTIQPDLNAKLVFPCIIGVTLVIIGNYLPTVTRNRLIGFRTPWSTQSELSWKKTNRLGGYAMSVFGIMLVAGGIFKSSLVNILAVVLIFTSVIVLVFLSYYYWKKDPERK